MADRTGKYEIKDIYYRDAGTDGSTMTAFGQRAAQTKDIAGQYCVTKRGNETMKGLMLMYGSHDDYGPYVEGSKTEPRAYNPRGTIDPTLYKLMGAHVDQLRADGMGAHDSELWHCP